MSLTVLERRSLKDINPQCWGKSMGTSVGVGYSVHRNPEEAGKEAALKALERKGPGKPDFVFVFATVGYNQQVLIRTIRETTSGAPLSGCSGEGIITQGMVAETNFGVCVMAISSDELRFDNVRVKEIAREADLAGERLAAELKPLLTADSIACFLFIDGLVFDFDPFRAAFEKSLQNRQLLCSADWLPTTGLSERPTSIMTTRCFPKEYPAS